MGETNIKATSSHVGTDQGTLSSVTELEEGVCSLLLLLLSVQLKYGQIDVVEKFGMVLNAITAGKEHDNLLFEVALKVLAVLVFDIYGWKPNGWSLDEWGLFYLEE